MDRTALARKLREALFDHIETERRDALQDGAIDSLFEKVLASWGKPQPSEVNLVSPEELCRTWTSQQIEIAPQITCQCKPDTTSCGRCWPNPAIGDVNLDIMSVYALKDGTAQWVSMHDSMFLAASGSTQS